MGQGAIMNQAVVMAWGVVRNLHFQQAGALFRGVGTFEYGPRRTLV